MRSAPAVAFLGMCERAVYTRDGNTNLFKWNIIGLKPVLVSHIFPMSLQGIGLAFALFDPEPNDHHRFVLKDDSQNEIGRLEIKLEPSSPDDPRAIIQTDATPMMIPPSSWVTTIIPGERTNILIPQPGLYTLCLSSDNGEALLGTLNFALIDPDPLSLERIAAIRSDPFAAKHVRVEIKCNNCGDSLSPYAALEKRPTVESEGGIWYEDMPDKFHCGCGALQLDLSIMKRNLHGILGGHLTPRGNVLYVPMYETGALEDIRDKFEILLNEDPPEERLQKFIEENPLILHQFSPEKMYFKSPILTKYQTDFTVLNPQRELLFIELEKTTTPLMIKGGGTAAELQHAFDQVRDWLHLADEQRVAVLDCIGVDRNSVGRVSGVVIAGRDTKWNKNHLRRLKGTDFGRIRFLTYDDLLAGLIALIQAVKQL